MKYQCGKNYMHMITLLRQFVCVCACVIVNSVPASWPKTVSTELFYV